VLLFFAGLIGLFLVRRPRRTVIFLRLFAELRESHTFSEISLHAEGLLLTGSSKPCDVML
jgi:hypothetical protein